MLCRIYAIIAIKHDFVIHKHSQGPSGRLKTSGFALGFQHFPRDLANVNEWKIMFDPSNETKQAARGQGNENQYGHTDSKQYNLSLVVRKPVCGISDQV